MLKSQAISSISLKKFHAQGGSVYALYPNVDLSNAVNFIVSLQTISDYLDNLCDRAGIEDDSAFRQLHLSMLDAIDTRREISDYYLYYPYKSDNGYLDQLVKNCRSQISKLPSYNLVVDTAIKYVELYTNLQTYKHLSPDVRERRLKSWALEFSNFYPDLSCWEFSAATGSTLGIFMLFAIASDPDLTEKDVLQVDLAYFPWISGLHILLDYYIDQQEDLETGDLNFTSYYKNLKHCEERLSFFIEKSFEQCNNLRYPKFHYTIVMGLLAMYLSDPKSLNGTNKVDNL